MPSPTTSQSWPLHPGDWVLAEPHGDFFRILHRTPNEKEAQRLINELSQSGRPLFVFQAKGMVVCQ